MAKKMSIVPPSTNGGGRGVVKAVPGKGKGKGKGKRLPRPAGY